MMNFALKIDKVLKFAEVVIFLLFTDSFETRTAE